MVEKQSQCRGGRVTIACGRRRRSRRTPVVLDLIAIGSQLRLHRVSLASRRHCSGMVAGNHTVRLDRQLTEMPNGTPRWSRAVTPEAHFITLCTREAEAVPEAQWRAACAAVSDWDRVVTTADDHRVTAFVRRGAARGATLLPADAERGLRGDVLIRWTLTKQLSAMLIRSVAALVAAQVPVIVLKGPALAATIYPAAGLRPYDDIDLVVQAGDDDAAAAALRDCGLVEGSFDAEVRRRAHGGHLHDAAYHRVFRSQNEQLMIELHADPLQLGLATTCEAGRWERAQPVAGLPGALMLGWEDQIVQLSVHAHKHGFSRLIWLKDLDLLLRRQAVNWDLVARVARAEGVTASVWCTLEHSAAVLGSPVPPAALARFRPAALTRALYRRLWPLERTAALDGHMRRRAVQFHAAESWRGMVPSLVLMGRRRERCQAIFSAVFQR